MNLPIRIVQILLLGGVLALLSPENLQAQERDAKSAADLPIEGLPLEGQTTRLSFATDEGSWLSIDITPDGSTLVFDMLGDLYRLPIEGGEATRLTSGLGFDSQPTIAPNGEWIAFVSDRNGADNLWVANIDGSEPRMLSEEKQWGIISPAWTPDSQYVVVTRTALKPELTLYHINGGKGVTLVGTSEDEPFWGVGADVSPDGKYLYVAAPAKSNGPVEDFPATQLSRYEFDSGAADQLTRAEGGAVRPVVSPDGNRIVYGTRMETQTGLRIRDLQTGDDRWLTYPVQRDGQENFSSRPPSRDLLPGYAFTPDGDAIVFNAMGKIWRVDTTTAEREEIPFVVDIELDIGPDLTAPYRVPQGDLTATLIHDPELSPDQEKIAASVLTKIYVMDATAGAAPQRLTSSDAWEFKPVWSPDGRWIAYVTWSMEEGGHIWRARSNGSGRPQQLTDTAAFYTDVTYTPDGETLLAMRGSEYMRHQTFSEFTGLGIPLELVSLPADGGADRVITSANGARFPHFGADDRRIFLVDEESLFSIQFDGSDRREELVVTGPRGNRRVEEPPPAESMRVSPDGKYALAFVNKQVWATPFTRIGSKAATIDVRGPALPAVLSAK